MKTFLNVLLIAVILCTLPVNAHIYSSEQGQIDFLADLTSHLGTLTEIIESIDAKDKSDWPSIQRELSILKDEVTTLDLPETNTPVYDVMKYTSIQCIEETHYGLDPSLSELARVGVILDSLQYMRIILVITENAEGLIN